MSRCSYREITVVFRSIFNIPVALGVILSIVISTTAALQAQVPPPERPRFSYPGLPFSVGQDMPELRIHYRTLGKPTVNSSGRTTNAVLLLHGTGASGAQFMERSFSDVLFGDGAAPGY